MASPEPSAHELLDLGNLPIFYCPPSSKLPIMRRIHACDDILYTKNGATFTYLWMLETLSDLLKQYSFQVEPDEKLLVNYLRNKNM